MSESQSPEMRSERATAGAAQTGAHDPDESQQAQSPPPLHEVIAKFVRTARFEDLPPEVIEKTKAHIVYLLGRAFSGYYNYETDIARAVLRRLDQGSEGVTVIGEHIRLSPSDAAFANGTMMRALFLDDLLFPGGVHPGVVTLPASLALGQLHRATGRELLMSVVLGYEVLGKLGADVHVWETSQPRRPTMIFGGYGPVTAAGRLLNLNDSQMANAFGYAANLCMGVPEGGQMDHFYGFFSRNGVLAAQLARAGGTPNSRYTLEGNLGLYASFFGSVPAGLPQAVASLGADWDILRAEYKRHHGTGANTVAIELLLALMREHRLKASQIASVRVALPQGSAARKENFTRGPFQTAMAAYSSLPYALARALMDGRVAEEQYTMTEIRNPAALTLASTIEFVFEDRTGRYCRVEVVTRAGQRHVATLDGFMFPFPRSEWRAWLQEDGGRLLGTKAVLAIEQDIADLEHVPDVSRFIARLRPGSHRRQALSTQ